MSGPRWMGLAERAFNALLFLYPADLRREHGDEMRQVFRDRCREAAGGGAAARLLLLEMLPDTVHGLADAHWNEGFGGMRRWHVLAAALLLLGAGWLLFQDRVSTQLLDWTFRAKYALQNAREERMLAAEEEQVGQLASLLAKEDSAASKAQAAYLYLGLYDARVGYFVYGEAHATEERYASSGRLLPQFAEAARSTATASLRGSGAAWVAAAGAQACVPAVGCDRAQAISRLQALEPRNAYAWALAFKHASLAHDESGMRAALDGISASTRYDDHRSGIRTAIFASSVRLLPQDAEARATVAKRIAASGWIDTADFTHDVRVQCALRAATSAPPPAPPTWAESHPESAAACLRFATLLAQSDGAWNAFRGHALLTQYDDTPPRRAALERAKQLYLASSDIGTTPTGELHHWVAWTTQEWNRWASAWTPGATEASVARRWRETAN